FHETHKRAPAVVEMRGPMLRFRRAKRMHVETNVFAAAAISAPFESLHLVESAAQIGAAEWFVLIEFQPVLIVEMQRPELAKTQREFDFIRRIEPGKNRVRGLD